VYSLKLELIHGNNKQSKGKIVPVYPMEEYRGNESVTPLILNLRARWKILVQIGANWCKSRPGRLHLKKNSAHCIGGWVGPRAGLDAEKKKNISYTRDLYSFGMLPSVDWYLVTEVSGHTIGTIFKVQAVQVYFFDINKCLIFMEPEFTVFVRACQWLSHASCIQSTF
jgi:hypothetical protein